MAPMVAMACSVRSAIMVACSGLMNPAATAAAEMPAMMPMADLASLCSLLFLPKVLPMIGD